MPILLFVAALIFIFGQDHPCGRWEDRPKSTVYLEKDHPVTSSVDINQKKDFQNTEAQGQEGDHGDVTPANSTLKVEGSPSLVAYLRILTSLMTWLPLFTYMTTFGLELAIDSNMANILFASFSTKRKGFTQTQAGYYTSIL